MAIELGRISAEIQSINSGFKVQREQAVTEAQAKMERQFAVRLRNATEEVRQQLQREITEEKGYCYLTTPDESEYRQRSMPATPTA